MRLLVLRSVSFISTVGPVLVVVLVFNLNELVKITLKHWFSNKYFLVFATLEENILKKKNKIKGMYIQKGIVCDLNVQRQDNVKCN